MNAAARVALLCGLLMCSGGMLLATRGAVVRQRCDARVMPWAEPGWRQSVTSPRSVRADRLRTIVSSDELMTAALGFMLMIAAMVAAFPAHPLASIPAAILGATCAVWLRQSLRARRRARINNVIADHVPQIADLLSLHVGAGLTVARALAEVGDLIEGPAAAIIRAVSADIEQGQSAPCALRSSCRRESSNQWRTLAESLASCIERGTPIAAALRAQAKDIRHARAQQVLTASGNQEVAMLVPIVFVVLPAIVVVAMFPGWQELQGLL